MDVNVFVQVSSNSAFWVCRKVIVVMFKGASASCLYIAEKENIQKPNFRNMKSKIPF